MIPPSPLLSARKMSVTYLIDTMIISDQKITETTPMTFSGVNGTRPDPAKTSCTV